MIYGSVCSGIEAATVAWHSLGWRAAFYAEIDAFPCALLSHYYSTPNYGDMTKFAEWPDADIDVLVGGTPCQAFSIAGLRKGLADPRGNLTLTYLALAGRYRPDWILWENVPGVLSQDGGRAFGSFLGGLAELGYGWAYRVMDAQYFKLAQRRPRVFVIASTRGWASAAAVLFERESLQGHPAPSREARESSTYDTAPSLTASGRGVDRPGESRGQDPVIACRQVSPAIKARDCKGVSSDGDGDGMPLIVHALRGEGCDASEDGTGRGTPIIAFHARQDPDSGPVTHPLDTDGTSIGVLQPYTLAIRGRGDSHQLEYRQDGTANAVLTPNGGRAGIGVGAVAFAQNSRDEVIGKDVADSLKSGGGKPGQSYPAIRSGMAVRRLTPRECERLQGFPDDHTLIPYKGRPAKDTPRYKSLGNSMPVPVMRWLGERIELVEGLAQERTA